MSFPKFGHPACGWIALVPLLYAITQESFGQPNRRRQGYGESAEAYAKADGWQHSRAFFLGLTTGFVYFTGTLYWISNVVGFYGGLNLPLSVLVTGLLIAYLALFPAVFSLLFARAYVRYGIRAFTLAVPLWVATELGREHLLSGFPWVLLGYSQVTVLPIAQLASIIGVYGLSGFIVLVNAAIAGSLALARHDALRLLATTFASVICVGLWGAWRLNQPVESSDENRIRVAMIQANIAQEDKWNPALKDLILARHIDMSRLAASQGARLIVWPESSTPFFFEEDSARAELVRSLARSTRTYVLVGSDQLERGPETKYFNAAFLIRPDGSTAHVYRKIHLVPFGEYVPLKQLLFFAAPLIESVSDFSPGGETAVLPVEEHLVSTAICYEVIYPNLIGQFVDKGSELLTTITNDAWYGHTSAPHQHFAQAAMRAIEQGRYLVRAANTGISGIVDPKGRVVVKSGIFEPATLVEDVTFRRGRTVYGTIGDTFAYGCLAVTLWVFVDTRRRARSAEVRSQKSEVRLRGHSLNSDS